MRHDRAAFLQQIASLPPAEQAAELQEFDAHEDMQATLCHLPKAGELDRLLRFFLLADEIYRFAPEEIREAECRLADFKGRMNAKAHAAGQPLPFPEVEPSS